MSEQKFLRSESLLKRGIKVSIYLPVPQISQNKIMEFAEKILFPQYFEAVNKMILDYEKRSILPIRCIEWQEIKIKPLNWNEYGKLSQDGSIVLDNDAFCELKRYSND